MNTFPARATALFSLVGLCILCTTGCGGGKPEAAAGAETPAQAIEAIIRLYETQDFDSLIRTRYAEISKAQNDQQIQQLIDGFKTRFQDPNAIVQVIAAYRAAQNVTPEFTEDGTVATYRIGGGFLRLSLMPDGRWGFHL